MRDVSIPAWSTLREPSSSSVAPSEDELQEQSSQESMARARGSGPSITTRIRPDGASGASGSRSVSGRGVGVGGAGPSGTKASGSAAHQHVELGSLSQARRPHSSDSEEEEVQRPKKKKKRILNPETDRKALEQTRVNAPSAAQSRRASYASGLAFRDITRGTRQLGLDIGSLDKEKGSSADRQRASASQLSTSNRPAPTTSTSAPQLPRTNTLKPSQQSSRSTEKRRASAPVSQSLNVEVIEILDSDDEEATTPHRVSPPKPPPKQPPPKRLSSLPRRKTIIPRTRGSVAFKEVDGVIILDDSEDDINVPPPPAAPASTLRHKDPSVPPGPSAASPVARSSTPQHQSPPPPMRRSPSVPPSVRSASLVPQAPIRGSPTPSFERAVSPPVATEQEDVSMPDDPDSEPVRDIISDVEMHDNAPESEDVSLPEQSQEGMKQRQGEIPPVDEPAAQIEQPISDTPPIAQQSPPSTTASSPPQEGSPPRDDSDAFETATSTLRAASPPEVEPEADTPPPVAAPQPSSLAGATKALISRLSSVALSPVESDPVREGTTSPVSSMLDPRLQDLAISGAPIEGSASPAQPSTPNTMNDAPISPSALRAKTRSPKLPSTSPVRRMRLTKLLYGGNDGLFKGMLRAAQKRRSSSQQSGASSPSPCSTSARISPSTSIATSRMSPKLPQTLTIKSVPTLTPPVSVQKPIESTAVTALPIPVESVSSTEQDSPEHDHAAEIVMEVEQQGSGMFKSTATVEEEVLSATRPAEDRQEFSDVDTAVGQAPGPPEPATSVGSDLPLREAVEGTSGTALLEHKPPVPLGRTLSQVIRQASNDKARNNPIDLTEDDESATQPTANVDNARPDAQVSSPVSPTSEVAAVPLPTPRPAQSKSLDAIRSIRKRAASIRRPSGSMQQSPPDMPHSPLKEKGPAIPLPRHFRKFSAPSATQHIAVPPPFKLPAKAGPSQSSAQVAASSSEPSSGPSSPTALVEVPVGAKVARPPPIYIRVPPLSRPSSAAAGPITTASKHSGPVASMDELPAVPAVDLEQAATPPMSPAETTDVTDEEECRRSLLYPSTTPEESPEVEIPDEDEHPVRPLPGGRNRGQASSEASSSVSGPRRSARLSSSSANSSVEPLDEVDEPRRRLRRREPIVRTFSEEDIASQGGISHDSKYAQVFEEAGFGSISWRKDKHRIAKEFAPITQLAEDIPHDLHDRLNQLSSSARRAGNMQVLIFEAEIRANTAEDEPSAPPIRIINVVDDEPTPPLEFYYSNLMWHGKGVPEPDYDALRGCGCNGPCDPDSKTCSCIRRQKQYWDEGNGFLYDKKGKVKGHEHPIFECNMNCGCSDDCPNRVVQHGRQYEIMIQKTPNKGWGIFAGSKKIPANTYIGVYAGEYLMDADGEARGKIYNKFGRTYLFDVDFWHIKQETGHEDIRYCIDAYHAGNFTRYLNHSCDPNCAIIAVYINEANIEKPLLAIFTKRDVEPYEELCFSYMGDVGDSDSDSDDDDGAPKTYGGGVYVKCQCGAPNCSGKMWK